MIQFNEAKRFSEGQKTVLVDIDETICFYTGKRRYDLSIPNYDNISKINKLHDDGWKVIYWTARGSTSGIDSLDHTISQLDKWGCKYHDIVTGTTKNPKPHFDMLIDDKAKRIEELPGKVGFTCSSFDILHPGHAIMLKDCKNVCDHLIIGLQTDPTIDRATKNKPIQSFEERKIMIESIKYVDEVVEYSTEDELRELIISINPDVRILGTDWKGKEYTGFELDIPIYWHVRDHDYSTTNLRLKIAKAERIKERIGYVNQQIAASDRVDGWVNAGMEKELIRLVEELNSI